MNNDTDILKIEGLTKIFGKDTVALNDCSFNVKKGSICAIVGESGCGKTTLLRLIAGLERSTNGTVTINNKLVSSDDSHVSPQKRGVGFVFQNYALFPHLSVKENVGYGLKEKNDKAIADLLYLVEMEGYENSYPSELSGGQQQRVAIARTLAREPELLLLDEPFSNLDGSLKITLRPEIKKIVKSLNTTMIFITHDLLDAFDIADEVLYLQQGRKIEHATLEEFTKNAKSNQTKMMLSQMKRTSEKLSSYLSEASFKI